MSEVDWSRLPDDAVLKIMTYLPIADRYRASAVCRSWYNRLSDVRLWRQLKLNFAGHAEDKRLLDLVHQFGRWFRRFDLLVDQSQTENRRLGVECLKSIAEIDEPLGLNRLRIQFTGVNPLFYGGQDYAQALLRFFDSTPRPLTFVDLAGLPVMSDELVSAVSRCTHETLQFLNIQSKELVCNVESDCMLSLVKQCRQLRDLRICHASMSESIMQELAAADRSPLNHLSLLCRRQDKYFHHDLSESAWEKLLGMSPGLAVTLRFDASCPLEKVREIMKRPIPVWHLFLETYTDANAIATAVEYYQDSLRKLVVAARSSPTINSVVTDAAFWCKKLRSLHVMCVLLPETVRQILQLRPELNSHLGSYTLKSELDPHPWVTDEILDNIPIFI